MRLKNMHFNVNPDVMWSEDLYHKSVPVRGGYAEVDDNDVDTIEALKWRGYVEVVDKAATETKPQNTPSGVTVTDTE